MATASLGKTSRMDLRLNQDQRSNYEKAAALKGQTLTQWSISHLDEAARKDIEEAMITRLSAKDFDEFCELLEQPMPKAAIELLAREENWK